MRKPAFSEEKQVISRVKRIDVKVVDATAASSEPGGSSWTHTAPVGWATCSSATRNVLNMGLDAPRRIGQVDGLRARLHLVEAPLKKLFRALNLEALKGFERL